MAGQDSQEAAANPAIAATQADADEVKHSFSSSMTLDDTLPESQQGHEQRLASLLQYQADRSNAAQHEAMLRGTLSSAMAPSEATTERPETRR